MPRRLFATVLLTACLAGPGRADDNERFPSPEERRQIEAALRAEGFTGWGELALRSGSWKVEDAVGKEGRRYDLTVSNIDFSVRSRQPAD